MKLIVNPHKVEIDKEEAINEKEINISICKFEFADEITDDYVKEAYFTYNGKSYKQIIVNDVCTFPQEVLVKEGTVELGVVATYTDLISGQITRYNPSPVYFKTDLGSLREAQNSQPITPSEMEQYEQALQDGLSEVNAKLGDIEEALGEVDNLDIDANKVDNITTVTITDKLGDTKTVQILDGINGIDGKDGQDGKDGIDGKDGKDGIDGTNGVDGYSPVANVSKSNGTATITITDKNGTTTATVSDGIDGTNGRDGVDGQNGRDGYVQYTAGSNITIDQNNVISATVPSIDLSDYIGADKLVFAKAFVYTSSNKNDLNALFTGTTNNAEICGFFSDILTKAYKYAVNHNVQQETQITCVLILSFLGDFTNSSNMILFFDNQTGKFSGIGKKRNSLDMKQYTLAFNSKSMDTTNKTFTVGNAFLRSSVIGSETPTDDGHVANKKYVDDSIASAITNTLGGSY